MSYSKLANLSAREIEIVKIASVFIAIKYYENYHVSIGEIIQGSKF